MFWICFFFWDTRYDFCSDLWFLPCLYVCLNKSFLEVLQYPMSLSFIFHKDPRFHWNYYLTLPLTAYWNLVILRGGPQRPPPKISRKELSLTPCCYIAFVCLLYLGATCKNLDRIKIWARFQDLKILWN